MKNGHHVLSPFWPRVRILCLLGILLAIAQESFATSRALERYRRGGVPISYVYTQASTGLAITVGAYAIAFWAVSGVYRVRAVAARPHQLSGPGSALLTFMSGCLAGAAMGSVFVIFLGGLILDLLFFADAWACGVAWSVALVVTVGAVRCHPKRLETWEHWSFPLCVLLVSSLRVLVESLLHSQSGSKQPDPEIHAFEFGFDWGVSKLTVFYTLFATYVCFLQQPLIALVSRNKSVLVRFMASAAIILLAIQVTSYLWLAKTSMPRTLARFLPQYTHLHQGAVFDFVCVDPRTWDSLTAEQQRVLRRALMKYAAAVCSTESEIRELRKSYRFDSSGGMGASCRKEGCFLRWAVEDRGWFWFRAEHRYFGPGRGAALREITYVWICGAWVAIWDTGTILR